MSPLDEFAAHPQWLALALVALSLVIVVTLTVLTVSALFGLLMGRFIAHGDQPDRVTDSEAPTVQQVIHHALPGPWFDDQPSWSCSCGAVRLGTVGEMRAHRSTFGPHDIEGRQWGTPVGKPEGTER